MRFVFERLVAARREAVFDFHAAPGNLGGLFPPWQPCRVLGSGERVRCGGMLWLELGIAHCIPMVLGFRHVAYEPPARFAEELVHGPFARFDHVHEFDEHPAGTVVRDRMEIRLPGHYGGEAAVRWLVAPSIRAVFAYRHRMLERLAANGLGRE